MISSNFVRLWVIGTSVLVLSGCGSILWGHGVERNCCTHRYETVVISPGVTIPQDSEILYFSLKDENLQEDSVSGVPFGDAVLQKMLGSQDGKVVGGKTELEFIDVQTKRSETVSMLFMAYADLDKNHRLSTGEPFGLAREDVNQHINSSGVITVANLYSGDRFSQ